MSKSIKFLLAQQSGQRRINKDQWMQILDFSICIKTDFSNYDVDGAC